MSNALIIGNNAKFGSLFSTFCNTSMIVFQSSSFKERVYEEICSIDLVKLDKKRYCWLKKIHFLRKYIKKNQIDIIFTNRKDDLVYAFFAKLFLKRKPILICTFHNSLAWLKKSDVFWLSRAIKYCANGCVCLAKFVYDTLSKNISKDKLFYLPNSLKNTGYKMKIDYSIKDVVKVAYTAVINENKNQLFLVKQLSNISKLEGIKISLNLYGDIIDEKYYQRICEFLAFEKNDLLNVCFFGRVDEQFLKTNLFTNDIYVSVSKMEMSPYNILEAKLAGLPIIASNVGGQKDLISNKNDGFLFNFDKQNEFKDQLCYLINSIDYRTKFGKNAFRDAMVDHSFLNSAHKLQAFVDSLK